MKIIAYYLPQFHNIPENDEMWGEGFTEWTNVKAAKPLFEGHDQPVVPLNNNYYSLLDNKVIDWQIKLAKKYGIYGFCFYHYWYNGHLLLEKPILNFLADKSLDMPFCICWANHQWTTSWHPGEIKVVYDQKYNDKKDWKSHFEFLLPFLKDSRYISNDGKPLIVIYEAALIPEMNDMLDYWNALAKENGFSGIDFAYQSATPDTLPFFNSSRFKYDIEYQPQYVRTFPSRKQRLKIRFAGLLREINKKTLKLHASRKVQEKFAFQETGFTKYSYDELWEKILSSPPVSRKSIPGAFIRMDTTPRKGNRGIVTDGMTPEKFSRYLERLIRKTKDEYHKDMIFLFAWNEWAEGGYMEPDEKWKYASLEAVKNALDRTGEFPKY